jgi:glycosyltransferase involved in cell wall biosynthesis
MNLLMISGDRALAAGKRGAFYNTLEGLHKHFDRIDVICPHVAVQRYNMSVFGNVYVHPSPLPRILQWLWIWYAGKRIVREHQPSVMTVHEYAPFYNGFGAWLLHRAMGIPYFLEVMHIPGLPHASGMREQLYRWLSKIVLPWESRAATAVRVINRTQVPDFLVAAGVSADKIRHVPAFYIDFNAFMPQDLPKQYDIAFVARLARNKGLGLFLNVLKRTGLVGVVVGDGPLFARARRYAKRTKLKVHFAGFVSDSTAVADILNRSRLLLMTSLNEGGPRVVLEAMACGVPVVATPVGIVPDVLPPEAIEEWDASALAEKVQNILGDPALYERLQQSGLQAVQSFERSAAIAAYAEAIKGVAHE